MSSGTRSHTAPPSSGADRAPVTLPRLAEMKAAGEPIAMVTAYDYPSARIAEEAGVDVVLVGDSAAMVVLGYPGTESVSMDEMVMLGKAVRRGLKTPLMVGDMPMGSYEASNELAIHNAQRLVKETGCQVVKLEAGGTSVERARAIVRSGIPVMGHVGLTPQTATALGGYKAQGKTAQSAIQLCEDALALQSVGCFAIVFEAVPAAITEAIVEKLEVPTIGIGAGPSTAGQVLVFHDLLGITGGRMAKFVKRYANTHETMVAAMKEYAGEVRSRRFPEPDHVYGVEPVELAEFRRYLDQESLVSQKAWDWEPLS
jgi:3-methyl-2-oxobutanoate hydroxymethyltransferase